MENLNIIILVLLLIFSAVYIIATISIYDFLRKRGEKVSFIFLRFFMISYAQKYRRITKEEYNKTGSLFWIWIISINAALLLFMLFLINSL